MEDYELDDDVPLRPSEEPEVVALGDQNVSEVKKIIKDAETAEEQWRKQKLQDTLDNIQEACGLKGKEPKLTFDDDSSDCCLPDLEKARSSCGFQRNVDQFALWRKLADVKVGRADLEPQIFCPTKDLMDYILLKLNRLFPQLKLAWSEDSWNPNLHINGCPTKISMERLAIAYQGLLNISDTLSSQEVICNIVTKKLKELFI
jgi:hypothetical protein